MTPPRRLSRQKRTSTAPPMQLMPRDIEILKAVAEYRILRQDQIQKLFFTSRSTAQYRLAHLYQHGFLQRHFLPVYSGSSPTLYTLDRRGITLLKQEHELKSIYKWDAERGQQFLAHTLAINEVRIAVTQAARCANYTLLHWQSESDLKANYDRVTIKDKQGKSHTISLIPDSYFMLETPLGKAAFFLELDRGTMSIERFSTKIQAYQVYMASGAYQQRYQSRSLRILTITTSAARCKHLVAGAENVGAERKFLFTTLKQVQETDLLHTPIWNNPGNTPPVGLIPKSNDVL